MYYIYIVYMYILSHAINGYREWIQKQQHARNALDSWSAYWDHEEDAHVTEKEAWTFFPLSQAFKNIWNAYSLEVARILEEHDRKESQYPIEQIIDTLSDPWIQVKARIAGIMEAIK